MTTVTGGRLFAKALKREGVEKIFTLSGGHIMPIYYGCRDEGIEVIHVRHEATAVFAADAYARVTGKPGVAVTTAGPGIANSSSAMAEAYCHGTPLIHIGGAPALSLLDSGEEQDIDSIALMGAISKWARRIANPYRVPDYVSIAYRHALTPTEGPVFLDMGEDLMFQEFELEKVNFPESYRAEAEPFGDPDLVEAAADLLIAAERPGMMIGFGARFSTHHQEAVAELVEYLQIPVSVHTVCKGLFANEEEHPLFRMAGIQQEADVMLMLNVENDYLINKSKPPFFAPDVKLIQVNPDPLRIGYNAPAEIGIVGGIGPVCHKLLEAVREKTAKRKPPAWAGRAADLVEEVERPFTETYEDDSIPMNPGRCAYEVSRFLNAEGKDWTVVCDGGDAGVWMRRAAVARRPSQVMTMGPHGTLGCGPGFTLGAWAANGKPVLYYTGDGSFGFYPMEFDTFCRFGVPVVCVISNDSAWGMIKYSQDMRHADLTAPGRVGVDLEQMRAYEKMAGIWDGYGEKVTDPEEIVPAIQRGFASGRPSIINVEVDNVTTSPSTRGLVTYE
jgi:acetolactate synthase-1/2/3 large subunit